MSSSVETSRRYLQGFTLVEMLAVIAILIALTALMVPALAPARARALDGATQNFLSEIEVARSIAINERTRTRILLPHRANADLGADLALRSYALVSLDRGSIASSAPLWQLRSKWNRLPEGIAIEPSEGVMHPATGVQSEIDFTSTRLPRAEYDGPYLEFLPNGSGSLDPEAARRVVVFASGSVEETAGAASFRPDNEKLRTSVTVEPLTGTATAK